MIQVYYHPSPNPAKVALYREEAGLVYKWCRRTRPRRARTCIRG